ncbi:MAG TPA: hypothetical protein RMH99_26175 [Sandaracinaceae bacterium LLY-WYZ-13_1]|nr:hypothetical protein [Sandaracinaceae bacterium LLY-WYZ-13_1]
MRTNWLWMGALLLAACGGGAETTEGGAEPVEETAGAEETTPEETPAAEEAPEWPAWAEMDQETRGAYMEQVVVPRMNELFAEAGADNERLPTSVECATCHGENAREVGFAMPNDLYPLNPEEIPAMFESDDPELAATAQFMAGPVEHTMAELLGMEPYDPETGEGFGCTGCHAVAE